MTTQEVLLESDIAPDGVRIVIDWEKMVVGASVFIPCINTDSAKKQVTKMFKQQKWGLQHHVRIEGGKIGLRIWRTT
jgi:hypothetical protein